VAPAFMATVMNLRFHLSLSLSLFPIASILEHRASVKRFVSLQFLNPKTVGRTPWTVISPSQGRYLYKHRINTDTSMPWVRFEPTIPAFERAKAVHVLDHAAIVIGTGCITTGKFHCQECGSMAAGVLAVGKLELDERVNLLLTPWSKRRFFRVCCRHPPVFLRTKLCN
jgi:hypothetical protein